MSSLVRAQWRTRLAGSFEERPVEVRYFGHAERRWLLWPGSREAASTSWRPVTPEGMVPWVDYDAVVMTKTGPAHGSRQGFQVYTYGEYQGSFLSLREAQQWVEMVYGPLPWQRVRIEPQEVVHKSLGPTTEFTEPTTIWVIDTLPRLG